MSVVERAAPVPAGAQRVAFVAHWSPDERQTRSTLALIAELQRLDYRVIVSSTSTAERPLEFLPAEGGVPAVRLDDLTVLRRPNIGYDFGSWAAAMARYRPLLSLPYVLVVNDSLVGPFGPLDEVIGDFERTTADVWGMVESDQFASHLQSYFRGFRFGVLREPVLHRFWRDLRVIPDKSLLIEHYEFGFSHLLARNGFSTAAFVHHSEVVADGLNPTIYGWRELLAAGVPFVKRELLRRPELVSDGHRVPEVLAELFGIEVDRWC